MHVTDQMLCPSQTMASLLELPRVVVCELGTMIFFELIRVIIITVPAVLFRVGRAHPEGLFEKKHPQQRAKHC